MHDLILNAQQAGYDIGHARHDLSDDDFLRAEELGADKRHCVISRKADKTKHIGDFVESKGNDKAYLVRTHIHTQQV